MPTSVYIGQPGPFTGRNRQDWSRYKDRFNQFVFLNDVEDAKLKALFLVTIGQVTYDLLDRLIHPDKIDNQSVSQLTAALDKHFQPEVLPFVHVQRLQRRSRRTGEDILTFFRLITCYSAVMRIF